MAPVDMADYVVRVLPDQSWIYFRATMLEPILLTVKL